MVINPLKPLIYRIFAGAIFITLSWVAPVEFNSAGYDPARLLFSGARPAAASHQAAEQPQWPHEGSDLTPDPAVVFGRLPNGFRYILMGNNTPKDRLSMHLVVLAGSLHETDDQQGLAHYLEHMLFNGTTHFAPGELVKYFQSIGMNFGPDANAYTTFDKTVYDLLLPDNTAHSLENGLVVMQDYARGALLIPAEVERERNIVLSEKQTRDSASYRTYMASMKFSFQDTRISKRFPIGVEKVLKSADHGLLKDFYDAWYRPETMILVMVGAFDHKTAVSLIKEKFSGLIARAPPKPAPDIGQFAHQKVKPFYHFEKEAENTTIGIEVLRRVESIPDSLALQKKFLLWRLAERMIQNRLTFIAKKPETPITSGTIDSGFFLHQVQYASISAESRPENWEKALLLIEQSLRKALEHGFAASELARVKKEHQAELDIQIAKAATRDSRELAREIIDTVTQDRILLSPRQKKELFSPLLNHLTLKEVHDVFKEIWAPQHRLVTLTGNAQLSDPEKSAGQMIESAFHASQNIPVSEPEEKIAKEFPYLPEPPAAGNILQTENIADLGIVRVKFENGVHLNLRKSDFKKNEVLVNLIFGRGSSEQPKDLPGLAELSTAVVNESGLGALKKDELERAMAGKNTELTFQIKRGYFALKGSTVSGQIPLLFQLLYTYLKDPAYRPEAYAFSMEQFAQRYLKLSHSPDGAILLQGQRFFAGGDDRFGLPDFEKFKKLTLEDVRSFVDGPLRNAPIEISIAGDFDTAQVIEIAGKYLGSLDRQARLPEQKRHERPEFPAGRSLNVAVDTKIPKGLVIVAYPTDDFWDIGRTRRLSVLGDILSERLRVRIREALGLAYATYAYNRSSRVYPGFGSLRAMVHVDPPKAERVVGEIQRVVSGLVETGITLDELQRSLIPAARSIKDMVRTNEYWLDRVLTDVYRYPRQLEWARTLAADYAAITAGELDRLAKKYLDPKQAATVISRPKITPGPGK
ncbi:MAG: insulinase family protein [Desulfobacterales bacterium]|nr:insulinase family protein [Desulfobacterales bacterium]